MSKKIVLLFDVDATLIKTHGAGMRAMSRAFYDLMGWQDILNVVSPAGMTDPAIAEIVSQKYRQHSISQDEMDQVFNQYLIYLEDECARSDAFEVLPGIRSFLETCSGQSHLMLGLGTGNLEAGAKIKLARAKIDHYFSFGGFGSDASVRSDMLKAAVKKAETLLGYQLQSRQVVVIGDTHHDIQAGKAIHAHTIAVATGPYSMEQLKDYQPDLVLNDFTDHQAVTALINKIQSELN